MASKSVASKTSLRAGLKNCRMGGALFTCDAGKRSVAGKLFGVATPECPQDYAASPSGGLSRWLRANFHLASLSDGSGERTWRAAQSSAESGAEGACGFVADLLRQMVQCFSAAT